MKSSGAIKSAGLSSPMKRIGIARLSSEPRIRLTPGFIIALSWRTSLVARAMMSPICWRLWKVWLLPSRLRYSSSRASRSMRWAMNSLPATPSGSRIACATTRPRIARKIRKSCSADPLGLSTSLKAAPVSAGTAETMSVVSSVPRRKVASQRL